jgi:hypothetical protein
MSRWAAQIAKLKEIPEDDLNDEQKTKLSTEDALEEEVTYILLPVVACLACAIGGASGSWLWISSKSERKTDNASLHLTSTSACAVPLPPVVHPPTACGAGGDGSGKGRPA